MGRQSPNAIFPTNLHISANWTTVRGSSVYWWNTLHQGSTLSVFSKPKIDANMLYPLILTLIGFSLYCLVVVLLRARNEVLLRERRQTWVKTLIEEGAV